MRSRKLKIKRKEKCEVKSTHNNPTTLHVHTSSNHIVVDQEEKLRKKNQELKHRLCFLELGLGMMANLLMESFQMDGGSIHQSQNGNNDEENILYREAIQAICEILNGIEISLKSGALNGKKIGVASEVMTHIAPPFSSLEVVDGAGPSSGKSRIFIDESDSGGNTLTGLCNIQIVKNSTFVPISSLESLSTLAEVATAKVSAVAAEAETERGCGNRSETILNKDLPEYYYDGDYKVPLKKRRLLIGKGSGHGRGVGGDRISSFPPLPMQIVEN